MIDISPYMQRLEWLKEWMAGIIDSRIFPIKINLMAIPVSEIDMSEVIRIYRQTGVLYLRTNHDAEPTVAYTTFDEYCNYKQSLSKKAI